MDDSAQLQCPHCASTDRFVIFAYVAVKVEGRDYLTIIEEDGNREYGSEEACRCCACSHQSCMGDFYVES